MLTSSQMQKLQGYDLVSLQFLYHLSKGKIKTKHLIIIISPFCRINLYKKRNHRLFYIISPLSH